MRLCLTPRVYQGKEGQASSTKPRWEAVCPHQHQDCGDETRRLKHPLQLLHRPHEEDGTKRQTHKPLQVEQSHRRHSSQLPGSSCSGNRNSITINSSCQALDFQAFCVLPSFNPSRISEVGTISTLSKSKEKAQAVT